MFVPCFVVYCLVSFLDLQSSLWRRERETVGCFTLFVDLVSCGCSCSVAPTHGVVGWSAVCDCGIS